MCLLLPVVPNTLPFGTSTPTGHIGSVHLQARIFDQGDDFKRVHSTLSFFGDVHGKFDVVQECRNIDGCLETACTKVLPIPHEAMLTRAPNVTVGVKRLRCAEVLFQPGYQSNMKCEVYIRKELSFALRGGFYRCRAYDGQTSYTTTGLVSATPLSQAVVWPLVFVFSFASTSGFADQFHVEFTMT